MAHSDVWTNGSRKGRSLYLNISQNDALTAFVESLQPLRLDQLPEYLKRGRQHVAWKPELRRDQKIGKPPYHPRGFCASSKKPMSWATYKEAVQAYEHGGYAGIGYMLTAGLLLFYRLARN